MADRSYENHSDQETDVSRKRHYENDKEQESDDKETRARNAKRAYGKQPLLKLLVPNDAAGAIIGKGGANLGDLKSRYGASIRLSHNREFYPGTNERILILTGDVSQIIDLNNYIIDKIHQNAAEGRGNRSREKDERRGQQIKMILPNSTAGIIIGRGGASIKELMEETKAKIAIVGRDESKVRGERLLTITGNTEQRIEAARQVISKIAVDPDNMANTTLKYSYGSQDNKDYQGAMDRNHNEGGNIYPQNNDTNLPALSNNAWSSLGLSGVNKLDNLAEVAQQLVGLSQLGNRIEKSIKTTVQIQMEIPESLVDPIMGPQGNNLREFIQFSGAAIRFSSSNEFVGGQSVRILTIHGDLNQTQIGYHLVNQKITQVQNDMAMNGYQRR